MVCIESIKVVNVERDQINIARCKGMEFVKVDAGADVRPLEVAYELVTGRRFVNSRGEEICIGMAKDVQHILGLPFDAFERMDYDLKVAQGIRMRLRQELDDIKKMNFWQRLKCLFRGFR
jgi:hypothetical protein